MSSLNKLDPGLEPYYLAVSATMSRSGEVTYRVLTQSNFGERLSTDQCGTAQPTCNHIACRLANLGAAAIDWAYMIQIGTDLGTFHGEQLGLDMGPE
jgi:hypothetical protein